MLINFRWSMKQVCDANALPNGNMHKSHLLFGIFIAYITFDGGVHQASRKKDIFKEKSQRKCLLIKDNDASNVVNELREMACAVTHIIRFACLCALLISLTYLTTYRKQPTNDHANSPRTSAMHFKLRLFN